jgi:hypothetical protein
VQPIAVRYVHLLDTFKVGQQSNGVCTIVTAAFQRRDDLSLTRNDRQSLFDVPLRLGKTIVERSGVSVRGEGHHAAASPRFPAA